MIFVYILQSQKDKGYYIGITKNISIRLVRHNRGLVISTKYRRPFKLVYYELLSSYKDARLREIEIKSYKGGIQFRKLIGA